MKFHHLVDLPMPLSRAQRMPRLRRDLATALLAALLTACGGSGGSEAAPTTSSAGSSTTSSGSGTTITPGTGNPALGIKVAGDAPGRLVDVNGTTVQLRGVNVSALESQPIFQQKSDWNGQTGTATPNWTLIKSAWQTNAVRVPLNEASWLGYTCSIGSGSKSVNPNPNKDYQTTVANAVAGATAAGLYVIIDLHWTAPATYCPEAQNAMADSDNSATFWTQVATAFKGYPNVIFEPFNEPYVGSFSVLLNGGPQTSFNTGNGTLNVSWTSAGMQSLVDAIRNTGATNVILTSGLDYAKDLSGWLANKPTDALNQLGAVWHAYPAYGTTIGTAAYAKPDHWPGVGSDVTNILAAGYPVVITEFGDHDVATTGISTAPFASWLLPYADALGGGGVVGYMGWTWDVWGNPDDVLITDAAGDPTPLYGVYTKAHYLCRAAGTSTCP